MYFCLLVIMLSGSYGVTCTPLSGSATFDGNNSDTNPQPPSSPPPVFTNTSSTSEILLKLGFSFLRNRHPWTVLAIVLRPFSPKHFNYLAFLSFKRIWWRLSQNPIVETEFDIYVFIVFSWNNHFISVLNCSSH